MPRVAQLLALVFLGLALVFGATVALAASQASSKGLRINGMPLSVSSICSSAYTATVSGVDSDKNQSKHAFVHSITVNGQTVVMLIRVEMVTGRGVFVDVVSDQDITHLSTTVAGMSITTCPGHPATTKYHVDKEALVAAGGS